MTSDLPGFFPLCAEMDTKEQCWMRRRFWMLALMVAVTSVALFGFYTTRQPTAAEEKAITRYTQTMGKVLDLLRSDDWDENVDFSIQHPMVNIMEDRPLDIDELLQRTYHVRPGSRRYQTMVVPQLQKAEHQKDLTQKQIAAAEAQDLMHLQVQVHLNMFVVPMITGPDVKHDPKVPGATFVHQDRNNPFGHGVAYVLFFSNGKPGKWDETNGVYRNEFIHPPGTPYIENLEIRIFGPEDRIKELLRKIDWKQVNAALTL
jgi:hypothetical protein